MSFGDLDIFLILLLTLINGVFAMSEIAIVTARKARLHQLAEEGDEKARKALDLANSPNRLLSTVTTGITTVGVLSGAFGGATIAERLADFLIAHTSVGTYAHSISLAAVVIVITYLNLVIGELVPKRLALNNPERIASLVAGPMRVMAKIASPVVSILSLSTELMLKTLHVKPSGEPPITEEEIKILIEQGTLAGIFEEAEQDMVERVFRLGDRRVGVLMTPRKQITWLDLNDPVEKVKKKIGNSNYSRFPLCRGRLGNVLGIIHVRDVLARLLAGKSLDLLASMKQPLFVYENMHVLKVMELFRESGSQFALVIDEYGTIEGVVTLNDILESIIGDIPAVDDLEEAKVVQREDGSWLVDGMLPVDELKELLESRKLPGERAGHYQTLGGFVMTYLKRIPSEGEKFTCCGHIFEIVDMDGHRVDKVLIRRSEENAVDLEK